MESILGGDRFHHIQGSVCIVDGRGDFPTVADDASIVHQSLHIRIIKFGDLGKVEIGKSDTKVLPLTQDGQPGKA